jgi:hypothetical protein
MAMDAHLSFAASLIAFMKPGLYKINRLPEEIIAAAFGMLAALISKFGSRPTTSMIRLITSFASAEEANPVIGVFIYGFSIIAANEAIVCIILLGIATAAQKSHYSNKDYFFHGFYFCFFRHQYKLAKSFN